MVTDGQGNTLFLDTQNYAGIIQLGSSNNILPEAITIVGKSKGSNINKTELLLVDLDPEELLIILREFKRLQADEGARNKAISSEEYGPEGGSRINYKTAPMWGQTGGYTEFEARARQYTSIIVEN